MPHKAEKCNDGSDKYRCPVNRCPHATGSRVYIAKHFTNDHKDYRSWRDVFLNKDAPQFILKEDKLEFEEETASEAPSTAPQDQVIDVEAESARLVAA